MLAVLLHDQSLSPYYKKQQDIRNSRENQRPFVSRHPSENLAPPNFDGGLLHSPLSYSFPPSLALNLNPHHLHQHPPLLPLPFSKPYNNTANYYSRSRGLSCPPINRKINNRIRDLSLTPKKSKPSTIRPGPKKDELQKPEIFKSTTITSSEESLIQFGSTKRLGPDPNDLPKDVSKVLSLSSSSGPNNVINSFSSTLTTEDELDKFSGSVVFTLSPPPSRLPLPTFCLRPKLSCNAEAAGIDARATDSLRRLLRLRFVISSCVFGLG